MDTAPLPPELRKEISNALLHLRPARERHRDYLVELLATVLLALATVGSAWSAYQSTRWSGEQSFQYSKANALRAESVRASTEMSLRVEIDVGLFESWVEAFAHGDLRRADFYEQRFRNEFRPAFEAWRAEKHEPGTAPNGTPFTRPEYHSEQLQKSQQLADDATAAFENARQSNQNGDNFTFCVVLFASVLFFAGVSTKLLHPSLKYALLALAVLTMLVAVAYMFSLPQNIGFRL